MTEEKTIEFVVTPLELVNLQNEEIEKLEDIIDGQGHIISELNDRLAADRVALLAAKEWLEDPDYCWGLGAAYEDGVLGYSYYATDEQGNIEYDENGKPYIDDNVADYKDVIIEMNKGCICWDTAEAENYPAIVLWKQIWKALNPGKEFKPLEESTDV